jgi:hypothetical protein
VHDPFLLDPLGQPRLDFGDDPVGLCLQHGQVSLFGDKIAEVLAEQATESVALQRHLTELEAERARLEKIIETVQQTVADLDLAQIADPAVFFTGLRQDQDAVRTRLRKTYGEKAEATSLDAVAEHYASLLHYWQPSPEAYAGMGAMYLMDSTQRAIAEQADAELPAWLAAAIQAYAQCRLRPSRTPQ